MAADRGSDHMQPKSWLRHLEAPESLRGELEDMTNPGPCEKCNFLRVHPAHLATQH